MQHFPRLTLLASLFLLPLACGDDDGGSSAKDAATTSDSQTTSDGQPGTDSGLTSDASATDGGMPLACEGMICNGGDPTGTWSIASVCQTRPPDVLECGELTRQVDVDVTGTVTINEDMTFERDLTVNSATFTDTHPAACLPKGTISCEDFADGLDEATCTGDVAVSCECVTVLPNRSVVDDSGTWTSDGDDLILTIPGEGKEPNIETTKFCVANDDMYFTLSITDGFDVFYHWTRVD